MAGQRISGVSYRALTVPSLMDNLLNQVDAIKKQGMFFLPIDGDRSSHPAPPATSQPLPLLDDSWNGPGHVAVLGPEDLSFNDMDPSALIS